MEIYVEKPQWNSCQTSYTRLNLEQYPEEVQEQFHEFISTVPFIKSLISKDRPYAEDLPKDNEGKIIVDITKPHILKDMDYFRPAALKFMETGSYCEFTPNSNPNSPYMKFIMEEIRRCYHGYVRESDGEWISGDMYFLLNYCPINLTEKKEGSKRARRLLGFPDIWDGHYLKHHYIHNAREHGHHGAELSARGKGKSLNASGLLSKRFIFGEDEEVCRKVISYIAASDKKYLVANGDQTLDKFEFIINFLAQRNELNASWPHLRITSSLQNMQWQMGYKDVSSGVKRGTQNSVIGISAKDDESKLRGTRGVLYILEEYGCHIKGTEVLMADCTLKKVEDIQVSDLLMGPDGTARKVLDKYSGIDRMYKITLSNGDWQIVNSRHPIRFIKHCWGKKTDKELLCTPEQLINKDLQGCYIEKAQIEYPYKEVDIDPYFLGLWLGNGDSTRLDIANEDFEILEWLSENYVGEIQNLRQSKTCKNFHISKKDPLNLLFCKYNLYNNKHIPDNYIYNSKEIQLKVIAGLIDTDGTCSRYKHGIVYEITQRYDRKHILDAVKAMATNCGLRCVMGTRLSTGKKPGVLHYRLRISGDLSIIPTKIHRKIVAEKGHKYKERRNWSYYTFKIEEVGEGEYHGFLIDKDHLFVLKDGSIVHNSFPRLLELYSNLRFSVEEGDYVYGLIYSQGCVCAGTVVFDVYGKPVKIEDISVGDRLLGYTGTETSEENVTYITEPAYKECIRIYTERGDYMDCSTDHPVLTAEKNNNTIVNAAFYRANELKIGDTLLLPRIIGKFGNIHISYETAFLLGALFGKGNYSKEGCITLSITSEEEYEYYNSHFDIDISEIRKSKKKSQIYFKDFHAVLQKFGVDTRNFDNKKFPVNIFEWDKESVSAFLSGCFNAVGNIQIMRKKYRSIRLTSEYKEFLETVKWLLAKYGINAHIYRKNKPVRRLHSEINDRDYNMSPDMYYVLNITNAEDIVLFRENFKFLLKYKQARLDSYIPVKSKRRYYSIPFRLRNNGKGNYYKDKNITEVYGVPVKKIEYLGIQRIYNLTANTTHTYLTNGFISANTAGDSASDFQGAQEMSYRPEGYNLEAVPNVYDKAGQGGNSFTFFFPGYLNRAGCYDINGNSDVTKALLEILMDRYIVKYNSSKISTITRRIAEYPITPQEAMLKTSGNMFPVAALNERLNQLLTNPHILDDVYTGTLVMDSKGSVSFVPTSDVPITDFPLQDNKAAGALQIFALPEKDSEGKVFANRYVGGLDPVDSDESQTLSLYSFFILDLWTDSIVAEYTGRMPFADDCHELARKAALFYNATILYENNIKGTYAYFRRMNSSYLLADTPEYLRDKDIIKTIGLGNTGKGVTASQAVNNYANSLIRDWLLKPVPVIERNPETEEEEERTISNLYRLKNIALIRELIAYNPEINVDRIRALGMVMLYRESKIIQYGGTPRKSNNTDSSDLGNDPYFTENYKKNVLDRKNLYKNSRII